MAARTISHPRSLSGAVRDFTGTLLSLVAEFTFAALAVGLATRHIDQAGLAISLALAAAAMLALAAGVLREGRSLRSHPSVEVMGQQITY